jgi:sugar phosphate permease
VIRFLFGIGEGAYPSASLKGIAETFPKKERPRMASILMSSNYVGSAFAPLIIAPMILWLGWRETFFIIGAAGIVFVLFYWLFIKSPVQKEEKQSKKTEEKTSLKQLLKMPLMWQLVIAWFGLSMVNKGLDSWMPTYLMNVRNLDLKAIGILTPLPFVAAGIAMTIGGWIMDKYFSGKEKYLLISSASLTAIFLYLMYNASSVAMVITFQALVYFFKSFVFATVTALPQKMFSKDIIGSASGMINLGGQSAGFVSPLMIGILISAFNGSYDAAFWFLIASAGLSIISGLTIQRVRKSTEIDDAPTPTVS